MNTRNTNRITFCPGPGAKLQEWSTYQNEFFGRGDPHYQMIKKKTLNWIKKKTGQDEIIPIAGSGTTAAIVSINSFLSGNVLVINTGYYSKRWIDYIKNSSLKINLDTISYDEFIRKKIKKKYKWILFVYVETANCRKYDIIKVNNKKKSMNCKLMLDATASIGLEDKHNLADVIFFSSCKGLLGPTGLGFVAFKKKINYIKSKDLWFNLETHKNSKYTLGYNCIASLYGVSKKHFLYKKKILYAQKILSDQTLKKFSIPKIGIPLKVKLKKSIKKNKNLIFYNPRENPGYDVLFFLGIIKFNFNQIKSILKNKIVKNLLNK
ncbi:aminotransferase class V-fold PLP-dependent enzyme [Candidatus Pelagibacter sp.]|nr:aminotransferase class V-fold PLP-dependent enzyme [Candidatus Pelagibacter sp.]